MLLSSTNIRFVVVAALLLTFRGSAEAQQGCSAIDRNNPPLFISYAQLDDQAWDGKKYVKGALLKLKNNSTCRIAFLAGVGESRGDSSRWVMRNGRLVRVDVPLGSLSNGQRVSLEYLTKYPDKKELFIGGFGGDVLETVYLNGGDYVFFAVPLTNFRRGGDVLLPYFYEWDEGERGRISEKETGNLRRFQTVEHYLRFEREQLPNGTLKMNHE